MWNLGEIKNKIDNFDSILSSKLLLEGKLLEKGTLKAPEEIKPKDIVWIKYCGYHHPGLVFKVKNEIAYCILFSTTEGLHTLYKINKSRFIDSWSCKTICEINIKEAKEKFIGVFDNHKEYLLIKKMTKDYYKNLF